MNFIRDFLPDRVSFAAMIGCLLFTAVIIGLVALQSTFPPSSLYRDPLAVAATLTSGKETCCSPWLGSVNVLGTLLLFGSFTIGAFVFLYGVVADMSRRSLLFWLIAMANALFLAADDGFMLHETYGRRIGGILPLFQSLRIVGTSIFLYFWFRARRTPWDIFLPLALAAFIGSLAIDLNLEQTSDVLVIEDGFKLLGIAFWFVLFMGRGICEISHLHLKAQD
ncbi:MAG: hypothetical protein WA979_08965 [Pacificimonas sp.]